ncbi:AlbA family DNA-binding domain-containing protein [Glycomyces dulcitolivorans]|uniref:AlbA family DNA-binding domain-containing protein n=1 Tax=Glycomyces dulcitolivorans TaxID=2200759 RepID=UPI000DD44120|nr:ATP-binding protein [Glycomyces dulcitolivorans]
MTINLDRSSALLRPSQLEELVLAVRKASEQDEDDALEWKSTLDLDDPKQFTHHLVRQIIGFANRMPEEAARRYEGYGYIVVGVKPGELKGVVEIDPAQLSQKLRPFVGGISWFPEYVSVDDVQVLVIIVNAPKYGDAIHALHKKFDTWKVGTVFVRRAGIVEQADPADLQRLAARSHHSQAQTSVTLEVTAPLEPWPAKDVIEEWVASEVNILLARHGRNTRTVSNAYLEELREAILKRIFWALHDRDGTHLELAVNNLIGQPNRDLRVLISSADLSMLPEEWQRVVESDRMPRLPKLPVYNGLIEFDPIDVPGLWGYSGEPGYQVRSRKPLELTYDQFDLHPRETAELELIPVLAKPGTASIELHWRATAMNLNGVCEGSLTVSLTEPALWGDLFPVNTE